MIRCAGETHPHRSGSGAHGGGSRVGAKCLQQSVATTASGRDSSSRSPGGTRFRQSILDLRRRAAENTAVGLSAEGAGPRIPPSLRPMSTPRVTVSAPFLWSFRFPVSRRHSCRISRVRDSIPHLREMLRNRPGSPSKSSWKARSKRPRCSIKSSQSPTLRRHPFRSKPAAIAPPGNLRSLRVTPQAQLSQLAAPRRIRVSAPGREDEVHFRALVHINENGRCDRFVPLEIYEGLNTWFSAFLASWSTQPATLDGAPQATWMIYSARVGMKLAGLDSGTVRVLRDHEYTPSQQ